MTKKPNLGAYGYVAPTVPVVATAVTPASKDYLSNALIIVAVLLAFYLGYRFFKHMMQPVPLTVDNFNQQNSGNLNQLPNFGNGTTYL